MTEFLKQFAFTALPISLAAVMACGCQTYRVEYHKRPAYYREATMGGFEERVVLDDGTVLVYDMSDPRESGKRSTSAPRQEFKIREELEDGTIVLRALTPEHVIANTLECLENEEYRLLYDKMLSQHTRDEWKARGNSFEDFETFFAQHRGELMRALTRMYLGLSQVDTVIEHFDNGIIECRLAQRNAKSQSFTRIRMIREGYGLKLLTIR